MKKLVAQIKEELDAFVVNADAQVEKGNKAAGIEVNKLRVAAYCRVSTDSDEQALSYDAQVDHYTEYIKKKSNLGVCRCLCRRWHLWHRHEEA